MKQEFDSSCGPVPWREQHGNACVLWWRELGCSGFHSSHGKDSAAERPPPTKDTSPSAFQAPSTLCVRLCRPPPTSPLHIWMPPTPLRMFMYGCSCQKKVVVAGMWRAGKACQWLTPLLSIPAASIFQTTTVWSPKVNSLDPSKGGRGRPQWGADKAALLWL